MKHSSGQALVPLLIFITVGMIFSIAAIDFSISLSQINAVSNQGSDGLQAARTGIENAVLQLLRNPSYTGETMIIDDSTVVISVTGSSPNLTVQAEASNGETTRVLEATVTQTATMTALTNIEEL